MKARVRTQLKFRADPQLAQRVREYCAARSITETALCQAAVEQYLTGVSLHDIMLRRLDRMTQELGRLNLAMQLFGETFGAFVKIWFAHTPEVDDRDKPATRRDVVRRYQHFVDYVLRSVRDAHGTLLHQLLGGRVAIGDARELELLRQQAAAELIEPAAGMASGAMR